MRCLRAELTPPYWEVLSSAQTSSMTTRIDMASCVEISNHSTGTVSLVQFQLHRTVMTESACVHEKTVIASLLLVSR